jgi:hypothetical protein
MSRNGVASSVPSRRILITPRCSTTNRRCVSPGGEVTYRGSVKPEWMRVLWSVTWLEAGDASAAPRTRDVTPKVSWNRIDIGGLLL